MIAVVSILTMPILAMGLVTPAFLVAGGALLSAPILIHLLNRRRYKTVPWAAMDFLLRAMRRNRRRLRFESWLLLTVRCLLMALMGLALARPLGCDDSVLARMAAQRTGLNILIIDNSYSMAYPHPRGDAQTQLDQAKLLAKGLISRMSSGSESVVIITASSPAAAIVPKPSYDLEGARSAVDRIEQSSGGTDLAGALRLARRIASESGGLPHRSLVLITDGTQSAWEKPADAEAMSSLGRELGQTFQLSHYDLAFNGQWNQAVQDLASASHLVSSKFPNDFLALVRGYGPTAAATLQWKLDDRLLPGNESITPGIDTPAQVQSGVPLASGGRRVLSVQLAGDDPLKIDNQRWRVINVASEVKVLIVEGDRGVTGLAGSAAFLQTALTPPPSPGSTQAGSSSHFKAEVISDLELPNRPLPEYRAIILTNVAVVQPAVADQLQKYVQGGGALLLFMGEQVNIDNYNQVLLSRKLLPGPILRRVEIGNDAGSFLFDFNPNGVLHPFLQVFSGVERSGLETARIFTYLQVRPQADVAPNVVLRYQRDSRQGIDPHDPEDIAISEHVLGEGRVVYFSTTADGTWVSFNAKPVYPALMQEMVSGAISAGDRWMNLTAGQRLELPPSLRMTGSPELLDPQQKPVPISMTSGAYTAGPLSTPGIYHLSASGEDYPIAVNVPGDEADVRPVVAARIASILGGGAINLMGDELPVIGSQDDQGNDFGWAVMIVVLLLACGECYLAMRFGHHRRQGTVVSGDGASNPSGASTPLGASNPSGPQVSPSITSSPASGEPGTGGTLS